MTRLVERNLVCAVCAKESEQLLLASTNRRGSADLDLRPPESARTDKLMIIQRCPHCGYCGNIEEAVEGAVAVVASPAYQRAAAETQLPELVRLWHCYSLLASAQGDLASAGNRAHCVAWCCDDADLPDLAKHWRRYTIHLFHEAQTQKMPFAADAETETTILVDLYRRSGDFEAAIALCSQPSDAREEIVETILNFQRVLAEKRDTACYTIEDAEQSVPGR